MVLDASCLFASDEHILPGIITREQQLDAGGGLRIKLIGQERDGAVLFCWDALTPEQQDGIKRTHIGLHDPEARTNKIVFIHDKRVDLVNCTINEDHSMLGFVTVEVVNDVDSAGKKCKQDLYRAYLAEVSPQNRVFYLNIERTNYMMLQFLYTRGSSSAPSRESHMLVFLHKESIGVYHLPLMKLTDRVIMTGQPRKEQVFQRRYVWSQWDMNTQSLYVAHFRKVKQMSDGRVMMESFLTCYRFTGKTLCEFILEFPVDFAAMYLKFSNKSHYLHNGLSKCIQDSSVNMTMLSSDDGTLCLAYQHPYTSKSHGASGSAEIEDINYTIYMVHHGQKLNCTVSRLPKDVIERGRVSFSLLDGYVLAVLPGHFAHLLNVSITTEPGHHILYHGDVRVSPEYNASSMSCTQNLVPFFKKNAGCCLYDNESGKAYNVTVSADMLLNMFMMTTTISTRSAILIYLVSNHADILVIKKFFQALCNDITSPEVSPLMEDYLTSSLFCDMKKAVGIDVLRLLPYSTILPYTNQIEKDLYDSSLETKEYVNSNGGRLARVTYSKMRRCNFPIKTWHDDSRSSRWSRLHDHIQLMTGDGDNRLTISDIQDELDRLPEVRHNETKARSNSSASLFQKFVSATKSAFSSVSSEKPQDSCEPVNHSDNFDHKLGPLPSFLVGNQAASDKDKRFIESIQEIIKDYLNRSLPKIQEERNKNTAAVFSSAMVTNSIKLCYILWHVLKPVDSPIHLNFPADEVEQSLFHIYERFILAASSQCFPLPTGLQTYVSALGFKCLKFRLFIQYVDQGILPLTQDFVKQIFEGLKDDDISEQIKFQILSRLPQEESSIFIQQWHHPVCHSFLTSQYITACLSPDNSDTVRRYTQSYLQSRNRSESTNTDKNTSSGTVSFPPLATLMKTLQMKDKNLSTGRTQIGGFHITPQFLEECTLHNTLQQTKYNLNDISL